MLEFSEMINRLDPRMAPPHVSLACRKAKDLGYPPRGRPGFPPVTLASTDRRRDMMPRQSGAGHGAQDPRPGSRKILDQDKVKPRKVRYYLEQRDPEFAWKMAEVLCAYREVRHS
jgi:hypothetical protein